MLLNEARLRVMAVVMGLLLLFTMTDCRNLTEHPKLLTGSLVNITRNQTPSFNLPDLYLHPTKDQSSESQPNNSSTDYHPDLLELNNIHEHAEGSVNLTSKQAHQGDSKHHRHSPHHVQKPHKNRHHDNSTMQSPKLANKRREELAKQEGEDWSCGDKLDQLCCPLKDSTLPATRFPCRCRCTAMPVNADDAAYAPDADADYDNTEFPFCKTGEEGWATPKAGRKQTKAKRM